MTRRLTAIAAATCALVLANAAPAPAAPPAPERLTLRVVDLGAGYQRGERECIPTGLHGDGTSRVVDQLARLPHRACEMTFLRSWIAPGAPAGPREVSSRAYVFAGPEGPQLALTRPRTVASFMFLPTREDFEIVDPAPALGEQAAVLRAGEAGANGRGWWTTVVMWRSGAVLGVVETIDRVDDAASVQAAVRLALAQQARIVEPTALRPEDNDDAEVALDDPDLDVPVFWLGRELPARGKLPALRLDGVDGLLYDPPRFEPRATLEYSVRGGTDFVTLSLWKPRAIRRQLRAPRLRRRCVRTRDAGVDGIDAMLVAYPDPVPRDCDTRPNVWEAVAFLPGVAVTIEAGACRYDCGLRGSYGSPGGLRAVVRALRARPTPEPAG